MKKIILTISALSAALFSTAANADISISGSANVVYADAGGNSEAHIGGAVSFALSTVTDSGVTISSSAAMTNDNDAAGANNATTGLSSVTFGFSTGSITFADDVTLPTGKGKVGELVAHADSNQVAHTNDVELDGFDDGSGIAATMPLGNMTLNAVYVYDAGSSTAYTHGSDIDGATGTGQGVSLTIPMGDMSLVVATASNDDAGTESSTFGGSLTVPAGSGTLVVGLESSSNDQATNEGEAYSVKYTTSFDAVSLSVGYTGYDANSNTSSRTDLVASTALGGGASLFAEFSSLTGAGAAAETNSTSESTIAVGTSISF